MPRIPAGPCQTAYIDAMTASRLCAVQMFDVALSRRMCCSRVWSAMRNAGAPRRSFETPMIRPGKLRLYWSRAAKNAACGPPYPMGTPNRCELPTATSAPMAPGDFNKASAMGSVATTVAIERDRSAEISSSTSSTVPSASGTWSMAPKTPSHSSSHTRRGATTTSTPMYCARVRTTSSVCGHTLSSTKYFAAPARSTSFGREANSIAIASAAAVPSSSSDAFATSMPVRSQTRVWKFNNASRRPCAISAWYGVYAVYQPGFSSTFRRITEGTSTGWYPMPMYVFITRFCAANSRT